MTYVLRTCGFVYIVAIVVELARSRRVKRFLWQLLALLILVVLDALITSAITGRVSFGEGTSPGWVVVVMCVCVVLGIAARYIFYLKGSFSWLEFVKPLCISPIVLLPLIGSVQTSRELASVQVISFALLAFQNGFFWQVVLERASPVAHSSKLVPQEPPAAS